MRSAIRGAYFVSQETLDARQALLRSPAPSRLYSLPVDGKSPHQRRMDGRNEGQLFTGLVFTALTYNAGTAAYRSIADPLALSFVVVTYVVLLLLYWCLRQFESADRAWREKLKIAVWCLSTLLSVMFSHKVGAVMPWPIAIIVYCIAAITAGGGFWAFFLYRETAPDENKPKD